MKSNCEICGVEFDELTHDCLEEDSLLDELDFSLPTEVDEDYFNLVSNGVDETEENMYDGFQIID